MKIWKNKIEIEYFSKVAAIFITDLAALAAQTAQTALAAQTAQTAESCTTKFISNTRLGT
mgnify:CR=1 FL=1